MSLLAPGSGRKSAFFFLTCRIGTILRTPRGVMGVRAWNDKLSIGFPYVLLSSEESLCCYGNTLRTAKQARRINFLLADLCCCPQSLVLAWCVEPAIGEDPLQLSSGFFPGWKEAGTSQTYRVVPLWILLLCLGLSKCEMLCTAFISTYQNKWKHLI